MLTFYSNEQMTPCFFMIDPFPLKSEKIVFTLLFLNILQMFYSCQKSNPPVTKDISIL